MRGRQVGYACRAPRIRLRMFVKNILFTVITVSLFFAGL
jgi:F0F1-type ATP synthase membrane subunit c/vacuolar-type H+-ATPase subunit K